MIDDGDLAIDNVNVTRNNGGFLQELVGEGELVVPNEPGHSGEQHSSNRRREGGFEKEGISSLGGSFAHNVFVSLPAKERGEGVKRGSEGELIVEEAIFRGFE